MDQVSLALRPKNDVLSSIALDEVTNSIRIGVSTAAEIPRVAVLVEQAGVPKAAFTLVREDRSVSLSATMFLKDTVTPIVGGQRLWTNGTYCSIGLPVRYGNDSLPGLLFSGHCAGANGDSIGMSDHASSGPIRMIGVVVDNGQWTYGCSHGTCMHADAALARLIPSVASYHGGIAQGNVGAAIQPSAYWSGTWGDPQAFHAALNYGTGDGPFMVAADFTPGGEVVGQWMNKIGILTGWTEGQISQALIDIPTSLGYWISPAVRVNASTYSGDSGSPVFTANGDVGSVFGNPPVTFDGLVFAGTDTATISGHHLYRKFDYSPQYHVRFQQLYLNYIYTHR